VVTDTAMTATAVIAALLTVPRRRGVPPQRSRVVIASAATMPVLGPLLVIAGFGGVTSWDRHDAGRFPLHGITRDAEAVVDLLDIGVYHACALALALATPSGRVLPDPMTASPSHEVEHAAAGALRRRERDQLKRTFRP
jgi:hypothetical protein